MENSTHNNDHLAHKSADEGLKKLKELAEGIDICMFCTALKEQPFEVSPMSVQEVDEEGVIWFIASKESDKYHNIQQDNNVHLMFSDTSNYRFLTVYGTASFSTDQNRIDKYWNKMMEGWFEKGKDDPNIVLIAIKPNDSYYWDTKHNKMITLAQTLYSAITGAKNDSGVEGSIQL